MKSESGAIGEWREHWPTVLAAALGMSCTTIYVYSSGALIEPIEQETGWSRVQIGSGISIATATAALLGPVMGAAVDRFGPRRLAVPGILIFCTTIALLSFATTSLLLWWGLWLLVGIGGFGVKPAVWTAAVASLFQKSRGLALAVTLSGGSIGSMSVPILTTALAANYGWRNAYIGLALIWSVIVFPILLVFFRDARSKAPADRKTVRPVLPGLTIRQSMLSWRYLALALAMLVFTFVSMSFVITLIPILTWQGIPKASAAGLAAIVGAAAVVGRLGTGYLLDRFDARLITTVAMALPVATALLLMGAPASVPIAAVAILILGLSFGAEIDAVAFMVGHYFGLRHYGLLFGTLISASSVATGAAPLIAGYIHDSTGGYQPLLIAMIPLSLIAALLIAGLGRPAKWDAFSV